MIRFLIRHPSAFYCLMGVNLLVLIPLMITTGSAPPWLITSCAVATLGSLLFVAHANRGRR